MKRILMERGDHGPRLALMEENALLAYAVDQDEGIAAEQIYLARADRMLPGMAACFVRLTSRENGFLPFSECREKPKSGDKCLVQVKKPPVGEKLAYVTEDIALAGRYAILAPFSPLRTVSKRVTDEETRNRLLAMARRLAPEDMGLILRHESTGAEEKDIAAEIDDLLQKWRNLQFRAAFAQAPCRLEERESALRRMLRDEQGEIAEIVTDCPEEAESAGLPVRVCEAPFALYNVESKLKKSLARKVWLPCGGFLVIDRTEAMTVIDVNSGKFQGTRAGTESAFLRLNLEAAKEIARLLRLRNVGGVVIIDFVDMETEESRGRVQAALEEALMGDPVKTAVHGFTSLGLMELTRKKTEGGPGPLAPCPHCGGTGIQGGDTPL